MRSFANAKIFFLRALTHEHFAYDLNSLRTLCYEHYLIRTSADELLLTNLLQHELLAYKLPHTNRLYTNLIRYELFEYEPYPLRIFYTTNFCRYEHFITRTLSHTNICIRTFAYEHFLIRTLCLRTSVRLPDRSSRSMENSLMREPVGRWCTPEVPRLSKDSLKITS